MRRLRATLGIVVLSLAVCPARADAYFWAWLDELSGPHFIGFLVEWRVYCKAESVAQERQSLVKLNASLQKALQEHTDTLKTATDPDARRYFGNAVLYSGSAVAYIEDAIKSIDEDANRDVSPLVFKAFVWRSHASAHFEWGRKIVGKRTDGETPPQEPAEKPLPLGTRSFFPLVGGATLSLCNAKPLQRDRQYLTVSVGYAYNTKDANAADKNRMVTLGVSYNAVITPYLTVGTGGGLAAFTSTTQPNFQKLYIQPYIVDFRPFALKPNSEFLGPWWHVFYLRYSTIIFPTGFEPGRFGGVSPRYTAEWVHALGFHADMAPVIRKMQKRW